MSSFFLTTAIDYANSFSADGYTIFGVKAGGAQIVEVDKASFQAAARPVYDKFLKDPKLQDMVRRIGEVK